MTTADLTRTYTLAEVSEQTGLPLRPLQDGARAGKFEHLRIGRERRMTQAQVDALLAAHVETGTKTDNLARAKARGARAAARQATRQPTSGRTR